MSYLNGRRRASGLMLRQVLNRFDDRATHDELRRNFVKFLDTTGRQLLLTVADRWLMYRIAAYACRWRIYTWRLRDDLTCSDISADDSVHKAACIMRRRRLQHRHNNYHRHCTASRCRRSIFALCRLSKLFFSHWTAKMARRRTWWSISPWNIKKVHEICLMFQDPFWNISWNFWLSLISDLKLFTTWLKNAKLVGDTQCRSCTTTDTCL